MKRTPLTCALPVFLLLYLTSALAQTTVNGSLGGTISDPAGAVVPSAKITLTNVETSFVQTALSNGYGMYRFGRVSPGGYTLTVEKAGFQRVVRDGLVINVNSAGVADVQLQVGEVTTTVSVPGDVSVLQTQTVEMSALVDARRIRELPLNGRNFNRLTYLAPGVGGGDYNNPSISGARPTANTYAIDGVNSSDERSTGGISVDGGSGSSTYGGLGPNLISTEAVQEYRIITSDADATFGRSAGGQINIVTRSGSNQYHGSAYEYFRNSALDARNFFNTGPFFDSQGRSKVPPFRQNLFGASAGGAIIKDRHFFFGSYEGFRQRLQQSSTATLPSAALISLIPGDLGRYYNAFYFERGIVPSSGNAAGTFSPLTAQVRAAAIAAGFPSALFDGNGVNGEAGTTLVSTSPTRNINQDQFLIRTDHRLTDKLHASARYGFAQPQLTSASAAAPIDLSLDNRRWQSAEGSVIYTASPVHIFELRGSVLRSSFVTGSQAGLDPRLLKLGISPEFGLAFVYDTGLAAPTTGAHKGFIDNQTVPQIALLHTWTRGRLTLRAGLDVRRLNLNVANVAGAQPIFTYNGYVGRGSLLGESFGQAQSLAASARLVAFGVAGGVTGAMRGWRDTQQEYFSQADWRLRRDLTVNLGLRYSYFGVYREVNGVASNLYATNSSGSIVPEANSFQFGRLNNVVAAVAPGRPLYQPDRNNFAPRLGISYDFLGKGITVLRAGFGLYYDRLYHIVFSNNISNPPQAVSSSVAFVPFLLGGAVPVSGAGVPTVTGIDPAIRNPFTKRFNVAVEQRVDSATSVTVAYVGARGRNLLKGLEPDGGPAVPQALRPDPRFSDQVIYGNGGFSNYDSLQVSAWRRFTHGVESSLTYTYAQSKDNSSLDRIFGRTRSLLNLGANPAAAGFQGGGSQFVDLPGYADYGNSDFAVRHYLTFSHVVELPFGSGRKLLANARPLISHLVSGWSIAGVGILRSGEPFNVILGTDIYSIGDTSTSRPKLLSGSASDVYANGGTGRTQYLVPRTQALTVLGTPAPITDPSVAIPRNTFLSPSLRNYDVSVLRQFRVTDRVGMRIEANAFNVFNRAQFAAPTGTLTSALFGQVTATRAGTTPRQLQFGLKLGF